MDGNQQPRRRRVVDAVTGALPGSVVRWAAARGAPMARISGRTAVGSAALARALAMVARPPIPLRLRTGRVSLPDIADRFDRDVDDLRRWQAAGLLGPADDSDGDELGRAALDRAALVDLALEAGADEPSLIQAAAEGNLVLAALRCVLTTHGDMTGDEAAERADLPVDVLQAVWQALGFPAGALAAPTFDHRDIHALRTLRALHTVFTEDDLTEAAAVVGRAMAEVGAATTAVFRRRIAEPLLQAGGTEIDVVLRLAALRDLLVPTLAPLLEVALRGHLEAAIRSEISIEMEQLIEPGTGQRVLSVAFADLVGFTAASEWLSPSDVRGLSAALLRIAESTVNPRGGRVVKSIGDAVMFVAGDPVQCALSGVEVVERVAADPQLPPVRVGIAHGTVLPGYADYFGRTVNLASRLCSAAAADEVLLHAGEDVADEPSLAGAGLQAEPRIIESLKGIGDVEARVIRRPRGA